MSAAAKITPVEITPDTQPIYDFIVQLLEEKGAVPAVEAMLAYPYLQNGHIDSLAFIKFIFRVEERFSIQFSEADMLSESIKTVGGLMVLIVEKRNQASKPDSLSHAMSQTDHNQSMLADYRQYMLPVLNFRDIVLVRGQGSYVWDANGNRYLDLNSGQFCAVLGHSDPGVSRKILEISQTLQDTDTSTLTESVLLAAKKIHDRAPEMQARTMFLSTGAEAVECCLKYAKHIKEKSGVISFDKAYHGLTHGSAAYSMSRDRIRPTVEHSYVTATPLVFGDAESTENRAEVDRCIEDFRQTIMREKAYIAAAIFEPIISGGGFYFPPARYFKAIRTLCDDNDIFLVFDECQTGFGRTGSWFYYQQLECVPDFIVCAKAMGMGYPVSCVIANGKTVPHEKFVMEYFSSHQNESYAGALVSHLIDEIEARDLLNSNRATGEALLTRLGTVSAEFPLIRNVRGKGLMCAFDLTDTPGLNSKQVGDLFCKLAQHNGLLMQHCNFGRTLRLLPNYAASTEDFDFFETRLKATLTQFPATLNEAASHQAVLNQSD